MSDYKGFQSVQLTRPNKSTFDLSHDKRLTTRMGRLTPCLILECVPSDFFKGSSEMLVRLAPLLAPIYDQINVFVHFFFVPNRLLWEDWEEFITGGRLGVGIDPLVAPIPPYYDIGSILASSPEYFAKSSLMDYLGVPILPIAPDVAGDYDGIHLDYMPAAAYQLIWYEYYRDRNFVTDDDVEFPLPSGEVTPSDSGTEAETRLRSYKHDYFTSALPFTQRGQQVLIPIDTTVTYLDQSRMIRSDTDTPLTNDGFVGGNIGSAVPGGLFLNKQNLADDGIAGRIENIDTMSNTTSTINDFRSAYALQVWMERNAIGGSRYNESTEAHFGVKPQDSRLQRPEYIGGGRIPVKISEVVSTAYAVDGADTIPQANMAGHGVTYGNTNRFSYFCTEHGFIMGILSIMNPPSYHQGMPKMFRRRSFLDYPWPTFAKLGEQQVDKAELYALAVNLTEDVDGQIPLFGYQSRYADWKHIPNWNHGDFHDTLLFWTLTRNFEDTPELGQAFNEFDELTQDRIFAIAPDPETLTDNFWIYCHNAITVKRPLPYFGTPNTMGFV